MFRDIISLIRPVQWIKNGFVLVPLALSQKLTDPAFIKASVYAFLIFCVAASAVYVWNDIIDRNRDRMHPDKCLRPIASGRISVKFAGILALILAWIATGTAAKLDNAFFITIVSYFALNILYSTILKHIVIIDLFALSANYVLRILGGTLAIREPITSWVIILATLLALFLALGKRRGEYIALQGNAAEHRPILRAYNPYFLDQLLAVITSSIVMSWIFYTLDATIQTRLHTQLLPMTIPFVLYGIFRYQYLIHSEGQGESPSHTFLTDKPLMIDVTLWLTLIISLRFL